MYGHVVVPSQTLNASMNRDGATPSAQASAATSPVSDSVSHSRDQSVPSTADRSTGVTQCEGMGLGIWAPALDGDSQALDAKLQAHDTSAALIPDKGVSSSNADYLQAQVRADVGAGQSVARTLLIEAADPSTHIDSITGLCRSFGPVHAASQLGPGRFRVTFIDARDSSRARAAFSQFANVTEEQDGNQNQDHDVTGVQFSFPVQSCVAPPRALCYSIRSGAAHPPAFTRITCPCFYLRPLQSVLDMNLKVFKALSILCCTATSVHFEHTSKRNFLVLDHNVPSMICSLLKESIKFFRLRLFTPCRSS